jgi:hypothetical protein
MHVKIGKYKSWFGPYQLAEKLMFWVPKEKDEYGFPHTADRVHKFGEWLAYGSIEPEKEIGEVYSLFRENRKPTLIHRFLIWIDSIRPERTIKVRIDSWDTWSVDHTLAYIIHPLLVQLRKEVHGSPYVDNRDVPVELRSTSAPALTQEQKDCGDIDDNHHKRWEWVLDEMIFAFHSKIDDSWENQFESGESDLQFKKLEDGTSQMIHGKNHTKKYDWKGRKVYEKRIANGFRLFGKYYNNLWN